MFQTTMPKAFAIQGDTSITSIANLTCTPKNALFINMPCQTTDIKLLQVPECASCYAREGQRLPLAIFAPPPGLGTGSVPDCSTCPHVASGGAHRLHRPKWLLSSCAMTEMLRLQPWCKLQTIARTGEAQLTQIIATRWSVNFTTQTDNSIE